MRVESLPYQQSMGSRCSVWANLRRSVRVGKTFGTTGTFARFTTSILRASCMPRTRRGSSCLWLIRLPMEQHAWRRRKLLVGALLFVLVAANTPACTARNTRVGARQHGSPSPQYHAIMSSASGPLRAHNDTCATKCACASCTSCIRAVDVVAGTRAPACPPCVWCFANTASGGHCVPASAQNCTNTVQAKRQCDLSHAAPTAAEAEAEKVCRDAQGEIQSREAHSKCLTRRPHGVSGRHVLAQ